MDRLAALRSKGLELGEEVFDGVQVGGIGRQIEQGCASALDGLEHASHLVAAQIVEDDHLSGERVGTSTCSR